MKGRSEFRIHHQKGSDRRQGPRGDGVVRSARAGDSGQGNTKIFLRTL